MKNANRKRYALLPLLRKPHRTKNLSLNPKCRPRKSLQRPLCYSFCAAASIKESSLAEAKEGLKKSVRDAALEQRKTFVQLPTPSVDSPSPVRSATPRSGTPPVATPPVSEVPTLSFDETIKNAEKALSEGDFAKAIALYEQAQRLNPSEELEEKIRVIKKRREEYYRLKEIAEETEKSKGLEESLEAWQKVYEFRPAPSIKQKIEEVREKLQTAKKLLEEQEKRLQELREYYSNLKELRTLRGHNDWVLSVSFSPDGKLLASGSRDGTIKLWGR
ncbi:MAG: hypothetical protein N2234_03565 [Planctomycetota bacterium]|nr:hypothetical protein [Planctomycetota bacterium]